MASKKSRVGKGFSKGAKVGFVFGLSIGMLAYSPLGYLIWFMNEPTFGSELAAISVLLVAGVLLALFSAGGGILGGIFALLGIAFSAYIHR